MALVVKRSDKFPVGTVVSAYPSGTANRHHEGRPSGTALATATVDAAGVLTFSTLADGQYVLNATVGGLPANLTAASERFPQPRLLRQRIAARRASVGAIASGAVGVLDRSGAPQLPVG